MTDTKSKAADAAKATEPPAELPGGSGGSGNQTRIVLTDGMPQPPGVTARRTRRSQRERRKGPFVKYVGSASHRTIRPSDWKSLGIGLKNGDATHEWNTKNDYMIESENFSDEQLDYLLIDDVVHNGGHSFLEMDYDDKGQLVQVVDE